MALGSSGSVLGRHPPNTTEPEDVPPAPHFRAYDALVYRGASQRPGSNLAAAPHLASNSQALCKERSVQQEPTKAWKDMEGPYRLSYRYPSTVVV